MRKPMNLGGWNAPFFMGGRNVVGVCFITVVKKGGKMEDEENLKKNRIPKDHQRKDLKIPP